MEIRQKNLQEYLHDIAIDQLIDDYTSEGYTMTREEEIGPFRADLVARKGEETIVFEIKTNKLNPEKRERIEKLSDLIKELGYKFKIILATPPQKKSIEIGSIDQMIYEAVLDGTMPDKLEALSTRTMVSNVSDVDINKVEINEQGKIAVAGDGIIEVLLQWGRRDDEASMNDSFPFTFTAILQWDNEGGLSLEKLTALEVDTSSFYE